AGPERDRVGFVREQKALLFHLDSLGKAARRGGPLTGRSPRYRLPDWIPLPVWLGKQLSKA
ncbi:hypothetical protein, partial [Burkholderia ubonensis]|uniref:hypothetical protein n=1 Tax=Burkholderia ubonensis TaxID=101571 RepID=UPI001E57FB65